MRGTRLLRFITETPCMPSLPAHVHPGVGPGTERLAPEYTFHPRPNSAHPRDRRYGVGRLRHPQLPAEGDLSGARLRGDDQKAVFTLMNYFSPKGFPAHGPRISGRRKATGALRRLSGRENLPRVAPKRRWWRTTRWGGRTAFSPRGGCYAKRCTCRGRRAEIYRCTGFGRSWRTFGIHP